MDLRRFLDLYVSESQEHVALLHRSLLVLEQGDAGEAVDEAFRAAHTLKGLSAAMGYREVADLAHGLEDRLDEIRGGRLAASADVIDALLSTADALEAAISVAVTTPPQMEVAATEAPSGIEPAAGSGALPPDTVSVATVRLRADAPIKAARAMLVMRALADAAGVIGSDPESFDDDFGGTFRIFLDAAADTAAIEATISAAGEVESVEVVDAATARARLTAPAAPAPLRPAETPARQVRIDAQKLDGLAEGIGELSVLVGRLTPDAALPVELADMVARMGSVLAELQHDVLQLRMVPVRTAFERLPRVVRDAARSVDKDVELVVSGDDVELDRAILEEIGDPLVHLLRNAVDHGIEPVAERLRAGKPARGRIRVHAERDRSSVRIRVEDDGGGVPVERIVAKAQAAGLLAAGVETLGDEELFRVMSHAGLSTAEQVSAVSGRGVGMDVVVSRIRALGGAIDMHTQRGAGTVFAIRLPITLALAQALRVRVGGEHYAIPLTHVSEAIELSAADEEVSTVEVRGDRIPLVHLRSMLQAAAAIPGRAAVIAEIGDRRAALAVDELVGREQILVKSFEPVTGMLPYFSGATLLADGRPALVLDPLSVI